MGKRTHANGEHKDCFVLSGAGGSRGARLVGPGRAKQLILTGGLIDPATADKWGLVNAVVPGPALLERGLALANEIARGAPLAVRAAKRVINQLNDGLERGLELEAQAQNDLVHSDDFAAGTQALLTKTPPRWQGR